MVQRTYALRACDYCDIELPSNELIPITDRVVSGERQGSRSYFSTRRTIGRGTSSSTYYKVSNLKVCPECYEYRAAAIRRRRFMRFLGGCVVVAVIVGAIAGFIAIHPNGSATSNAKEYVPAKIVDEGALPVADKANITEMDPPTFGTADNQPGSAASPANDAPLREVDRSQDYQRGPTPPTTPRNIQDDYAVAINEATPAALESGRPETWAAAGRHGYVVPSSPQAYGDRTCRNIYSTIFNGEEQTESAAVKWCRMAEGGDWELSN